MEPIQRWGFAHERLKEAMKKEVATLRELLSNLLQEELFLAEQNKKGICLIREDRANILKMLSLDRKERLSATATIQKLVHAPSRGKKLPLHELLPKDDENTEQILNLHEQMRSLFEKLAEQKGRNVALDAHPPMPSLKPKKKKSALATFEENR